MKSGVKKIIATVLCVALVGGLIAVFAVSFVKNPAGDTQENYINAVFENEKFENDITQALPQTEIYNVIKAHFDAALPEGKTEKKAVVIGYDGCRNDVLKNINTKSDGAINTVLSDGGKLFSTYCGGVPLPFKNTQSTSTAPGWCSMLTGVFADVHGITGNGIVKSNDYLTLLTTLVESGAADSSAFYVSWKGHFVNDNSTYHDELEYIKQNNINSTFICSKNDRGTRTATLDDIKKDDCSDFIFMIMEYCDHAGHQTGFYANNPRYKSAFKNAEIAGDEIISAIKTRANYEKEDWLIIITTDHGGIATAHGGPSIQERYTFLALNKPELLNKTAIS